MYNRRRIRTRSQNKVAIDQMLTRGCLMLLMTLLLVVMLKMDREKVVHNVSFVWVVHCRQATSILHSQEKT